MNLLALIGRDTQLKRTSANHGGEYSGPCPLCRRGTDRFKVWPRLERWACLGPNAGRSGCDRGGDAPQYLRERDGLTYREACQRLGLDMDAKTQYRGPFARKDARQDAAAPLPAVAASDGGVEPASPPNARWQAHAHGLSARCEVLLWGATGSSARDYLHRRGLNDATLRAFHIGYNPQDIYEDHAEWGLTPPTATPEELAAHPHRIWVPRGITIPWVVNGAIWRLNVRRPLSRAQVAAGQAKYIGPAGFANALYNADALRGGRGDLLPQVAVLVEGEIDALTIVQACAAAPLGMRVAVVATGSTAGARRQPWIRRLAALPRVLVAFDHDQDAGGAAGAGDRAAAWWLTTLPNARRLQPLLHDINTQAQPALVAGWLAKGIATVGSFTLHP